jgi:hypothetical protein
MCSEQCKHPIFLSESVFAQHPVEGVWFFDLFFSAKTKIKNVKTIKPIPNTINISAILTPKRYESYERWCWPEKRPVWSHKRLICFSKKFQITNSKQITMTKIQNYKPVWVTEYWNLVFHWNLVRGIWDFRILQYSEIVRLPLYCLQNRQVSYEPVWNPLQADFFINFDHIENLWVAQIPSL